MRSCDVLELELVDETFGMEIRALARRSFIAFLPSSRVIGHLCALPTVEARVPESLPDRASPRRR